MLLSTSDRGGEAFIELGGGGGEEGARGSHRDKWKQTTHHKVQTGTNCRSLGGNKRGFLCFIDSSTMTLLGGNNVVINNSTAQGY